MGSTYFSKRIPMRAHKRSERSRPKTFSTEEKAKDFAENQGIKNFSITKLSEHKFRVEVKETKV